jgi:hypothetical protein
LLEKDNDDHCSRVTPYSSIYITPEWLAQNCYVDIYASVHGYNDRYYDNNIIKENDKVREEEEYSHPLKYCEVCRHLKLDYRKYCCYTDNGKNRQIITICIDCFRRYQEKRYELFGKPTGVIAVSDKSKVEGLIMCALRLALMNNGKATRNARSINGGSSSSVSTSTTVVTNNADIHLNPEYNDDDDNIFFYTAAANAFDHSPTIREYFHHDRSRINPKNKSLWPLRYRAYKEFGI